MKQNIFSVLILLSLLSDASCFCPQSIHPRYERKLSHPFANPPPNCNYQKPSVPHTWLQAHNSKKDSNFLMDQFKTADGEIIDPYRILKVGRKADKSEIRKSYRMLSKKYHPDVVRSRQVFPGKCNNLEEVRDEWERIKLAYEILSDRKMRIKYDRHSALNDPASAFGRLAVDTLGWGASNLVKGMIGLGDLAAKSAKDSLQKMSKEKINARKEVKSNKSEGISTQGAFVKFTTTTQDNLVMMQNNALILALPRKSMFAEETQGTFLANDFVLEVGKITMGALAWGMISMADVAVQMGEVIVKHARQELDKQMEDWKMQRVDLKYEM
mmetsp:Transcript_5519/g.10508  ORF Transcript_5519/g.10508 Transcript_5519/m.10508 type:complete len:327 (-) Transcript_5519:204-1184(-)